MLVFLKEIFNRYYYDIITLFLLYRKMYNLIFIIISNGLIMVLVIVCAHTKKPRISFDNNRLRVKLYKKNTTYKLKRLQNTRNV